MKSFYTVIFCFLAIGCAPTLVKDINSEEKIYQLSAYGNTFASIDSLQAKLEKKADKVCSGKRFKYVDLPDLEFKSVKYYANGVQTTSNSKVFRRTIQCM